MRCPSQGGGRHCFANNPQSDAGSDTGRKYNEQLGCGAATTERRLGEVVGNGPGGRGDTPTQKDAPPGSPRQGWSCDLLTTPPCFPESSDSKTRDVLHHSGPSKAPPPSHLQPISCLVTAEPGNGVLPPAMSTDRTDRHQAPPTCSAEHACRNNIRIE